MGRGTGWRWINNLYFVFMALGFWHAVRVVVYYYGTRHAFTTTFIFIVHKIEIFYVHV